MARYDKGGAPIQKASTPMPEKRSVKNKQWHPANRDHRSYSEVVLGLKKKIEQLEGKVEANHKIIPAIFNLNVEENSSIAKVLKVAAIAENTVPIDIKAILPRLQNYKTNIKGILFLSPTKLLLVFENENDAMNAVNTDCPLWNVFDDIRLWSEGEYFDDRLIWIECVGLHPLCWSKDNLKLIGEKWGQVMHIENKVQGVDSVTSARICLRTKAQNRIDNRIKLFSEHCSCDVWVKELYGYRGLNSDYGKQEMVTPLPSHFEDKMDEILTKTCHNSHPPCLSDPLVQVICDSMNLKEDLGWVDPLVCNENTEWKTDENLIPSPDQWTPVATPMSHSRPSKSRGRPRKPLQQQIPPESSSHGSLEIQKTWDLAQQLGISSNDEASVLSGLRKSKRILVLEGKGL